MTGKNFYDILGVTRDATTTHIRQAYVLRSKVMHPDRFDQAKQPQEWKLANELLQELNKANATLRDPILRRQYDESIFGSYTAPNPPRQPPPRPTPHKTKKSDTQKFDIPEDGAPAPARNLWAPPVFKGGFQFRSQPKSVQMRLKQRSDNRLSDQLRVPFQANSLVTNLIMVGFSTFCLWKTAQPSTQPWTTLGYIVIFIWCLIMGSAFGVGFGGLIKSFTHPLQSWVIVTPLYLIVMDYEEVFAWPLWDINSVSSRGTDKFQVVLQVGGIGTNVVFTLPNAGAYTNFYNYVTIRQKRLEVARINRETRFFDEINDLVAATPTRAEPLAYAAPVSSKAVTNISMLVGFGVFAYAALKAPAAPSMVPVAIAPPAPVVQPFIPPVIAPAIPAYPEQRSPEDGSVFSYSAFGDPSAEPVRIPSSQQESEVSTYAFPSKPSDPYAGIASETKPGIAPFTVNTPSGENYFIKMIDVATNKPVLGFYVSGGTSVTVKVPVGTYLVHCAFGKKWYGIGHLFGRSTGYSKLDDTFDFSENNRGISTETVTLYPVVNGNLKTATIDASEF
jgi:hypothetical protein